MSYFNKDYWTIFYPGHYVMSKFLYKYMTCYKLDRFALFHGLNTVSTTAVLDWNKLIQTNAPSTIPTFCLKMVAQSDFPTFFHTLRKDEGMDGSDPHSGCNCAAGRRPNDNKHASCVRYPARELATPAVCIEIFPWIYIVCDIPLELSHSTTSKTVVHQCHRTVQIRTW